MKYLENAVILTHLLSALRKQDSWCGETHVQKSVYLLSEVQGIDLGFRFILYHHGPFSFDLRGELTSLQADGLLALEFQPIPYGPRLAPTQAALDLQSRFPKTMAKYRPAVERIAQYLGNRGVNALERLATAVYVTRRQPEADPETRAEALAGLKPHIALEDAQAAIAEADGLLAAAVAPT